jgi:hypothetical protein
MQEHMRDAAYAANIPTPWGGAVAGYLNSRPEGDPAHPWTASDWIKFQANRKLPIFVQSHPVTDMAEADAFATLKALYDIGAPAGIRTALDLETAIDAEYVRRYGKVMRWSGFRVWVYGSASTVFGNPPLDGYWVADYLDGQPFLYDHPDVRATQYTNNPPASKYDSSAIRNWVYADVAHWWHS